MTEEKLTIKQALKKATSLYGNSVSVQELRLIDASAPDKIVTRQCLLTYQRANRAWNEVRAKSWDLAFKKAKEEDSL